MKIQWFNSWDDSFGTPDPFYFWAFACWSEYRVIRIDVTFMGIGFRLVFGEAEGDYVYNSETAWLRSECDRIYKHSELLRKQVLWLISTAKRQPTENGNFNVQFTQDNLVEADKIASFFPGPPILVEEEAALESPECKS